MQMQQPEQQQRSEQGNQEHDAYKAEYTSSNSSKQQQKIYPEKRKRPDKYFATPDLEERVEQAVQQKKQQRLERLVIRRYWIDIDGDNVGYGAPRESLILSVLIVLLLLTCIITTLLTHGINGVVAIFVVIDFILLGINAALYSPQTGYYVVDPQGKPTGFLQKRLSLDTPGLSRKQYIQRVQEQCETP